MVTNDYFKGLVVGGLIGLVSGILCAPKKGQETREEIRKSTEGLLEKAKGQYEQAIENIENLVGREKDAFVEKKGRLKKAVEVGVETFRKEQGSASSQI